MSSAPSGSSRSSTFGCLAMARASATRCRWPPESWSRLALAELLHLHELQHLGDARLDLRLRHARPASGRRRRCPRPSCAGTARRTGTSCSPAACAAARRESGLPSSQNEPRSAPRTRRACASAWSCRSPTGRAARGTRARRCRASGCRRRRTAEALRDAAELDQRLGGRIVPGLEFPADRAEDVLLPAMPSPRISAEGGGRRPLGGRRGGRAYWPVFTSVQMRGIFARWRGRSAVIV